jgi:hypothetical protein
METRAEIKMGDAKNVISTVEARVSPFENVDVRHSRALPE